MNDRALELLPEYVLGTLDEGETAEVEKALAQSPEVAAEMRAISDAYESLALSLEPVAPKSETKDRLFRSLEGSQRFLPFVDDLAKYFDLAAQKVKGLLEKIDDPDAWEDGPMAGIRLIHFDGGPNAFAADTGFVSFPAGLHFPYHQHKGPEMSYVLQGKIKDGDGTVYGPGDVIIKGVDSPHEYWVLDGEDCLIGIAHVAFEIVPKP